MAHSWRRYSPSGGEDLATGLDEELDILWGSSPFLLLCTVWDGSPHYEAAHVQDGSSQSEVRYHQIEIVDKKTHGSL